MSTGGSQQRYGGMAVLRCAPPDSLGSTMRGMFRGRNGATLIDITVPNDGHPSH